MNKHSVSTFVTLIDTQVCVCSLVTRVNSLMDEVITAVNIFYFSFIVQLMNSCLVHLLSWWIIHGKALPLC